MAVILHIETSTNVCSVAVSEDGQCIFEQTERGGMSHAEKLGTMVDEALSFTDNHAIPFDAVAVKGKKTKKEKSKRAFTVIILFIW